MTGTKSSAGARRPGLRLDKDLEILSEQTHEISGARLILARNRKSEMHPFITAWVAPWQKTVCDFIKHDCEAAAIADFDLKKTGEPPVTPALKRDWQRGIVYGWEDSSIRHHDSHLSRDHMNKIAGQVAAEFNLASPPTISARKQRSRWLADYDDESHHIRIHNGQWKLSFVLHELAHAVDSKVNGNKWSDHGPSFVRTLLTIVDRYKYWHDMAELEKSATESGIRIARAESLPLHRPPAAAPENPLQL